jgi:hypothetical protein
VHMSKVRSGVAGIGTALTASVMEVNDDSPDEELAAECLTATAPL